MGAYATALPGGVTVTEESAATLAEAWGFPVPSHAGLTAAEMPEAAERGELDVLWMSGGNFLDVLPDPPRVEAALASVPLRVHQDIVVSSQMLVPGDDVILLPVATRYEQEGGGTETTTERRIAFSPEIPRQVGLARSEWRLFADVARRVDPDLGSFFDWADNQALRAEIAQVVPAYAGIEDLATTGDAVQWGGRHLAPGGEFPTPSGRGRFTPLTPPSHDLPEGSFTVATRRGKQFNSMVFGERDPLTGAARDAVYIDAADAAVLGLVEGDRVTPALGDRRVHGPPAPGPAPEPVAAGALARGQRAHRGRRRAPRPGVAGARLQRRGHPGAGLTRPVAQPVKRGDAAAAVAAAAVGAAVVVVSTGWVGGVVGSVEHASVRSRRANAPPAPIVSTSTRPPGVAGDGEDHDGVDPRADLGGVERRERLGDRFVVDVVGVEPADVEGDVTQRTDGERHLVVPGVGVADGAQRRAHRRLAGTSGTGRDGESGEEKDDSDGGTDGAHGGSWFSDGQVGELYANSPDLPRKTGSPRIGRRGVAPTLSA